MPKRKPWDVPIVKFGKNGDFFVNFSGKKFYLGRDEKEARKNYIQFLRTLDEAETSGPAAQNGKRKHVQVQELILDCLRKYGSHPKYQKIKRVMQALRKCYGKAEADEFGRVKFQAVRKSLVKEQLAGSYVNELMRFVIWCFELGVENEKIPEGIPAALRAVRLLKRGEAKVNPPRMNAKDEDVLKALPFFSKTIRDMVVIQRLSGMRPSELFQLRPCDIEKDGEVWIYTPQKAKSDRFGKKRFVGLGKVEQKILAERIRKVRNDEPVFQPIHAVMERYGKRKLDGQSVRQLRKMYTKDSYRRAVKRGLERAERHGVKIQHWTPYQLRHSAATELSIQLGREAAGVMLGHASTDVTAGYDHSDREKVRRLTAKRDAEAGGSLVKWEGQ